MKMKFKFRHTHLSDQRIFFSSGGPSRTSGTVKGASRRKNVLGAKNTCSVVSSADQQAGVVRGSEGFTIIELMIATAVFSVVLLLCTLGLLEIGRAYYRGVTTTRTQEAARRILDDVSESIKFNGGQVVSNAGVRCIGNKRYSFVIDRMYTDASPNNHAMVVDNVNCSSGVTQINMNTALTDPNAQELLGTRMRISRFTIEGPLAGTTNLYRITVRVVTGENDLLDDKLLSTNGMAGTDGVRDTCKNQRVGSQFCAVSELSTTVQKRV